MNMHMRQYLSRCRRQIVTIISDERAKGKANTSFVRCENPTLTWFLNIETTYMFLTYCEENTIVCLQYIDMILLSQEDKMITN